MLQKLKRFPISISKTRFEQEPTDEQLAQTKYELDYLELRELFEFLNAGYTCCHYYKYTEGELFGSSAIHQDLFQEAHFICLDIYTPSYISFTQLHRLIDQKPSLSFPMKKDDSGLNRYCIIYLFNKPIRTHELYGQLAKSIEESLKLRCNALAMVDIHDPHLPLWGNPEPKIERVNSTNIFEFSDFIEISDNFIDTPPSQEKGCGMDDDFTDSEFRTDFYAIRDSSSFKAFENKYAEKYKFFDRSELPQVSSRDMYIELPVGYIEIERQYGKITDKYGENTRLKLLKMNAILRRKIKPDICFEYLLYCLTLERQYHFNNSDGKIKNDTLVQICKDAMCYDIANFQVKAPKRKSMVNPKFCEENFVSKRAIAGYRRTYVINAYLDENYNPQLTPKQNMEQFQKDNFKVSKTKIYDYCEANGISTKPWKTIS